jgi:predicted metal-dependent hydrolase
VNPKYNERMRKGEPGEFIAKASRASFTCQVQFEFNLKAANPSSAEESLALTRINIPIALIRNPRARRYVLRLSPDGSARVTIPRGGSVAEARRFAERNMAWVERTLQRLSTCPVRPTQWTIGTEIYFRGEPVTILAGVSSDSGCVRFGSEAIQVRNGAGDFRGVVEWHLWRLAGTEFPPRVFELAATHQLTVRRVTVRNQRSRWGSCLRRGTVSLNWRLIQTPVFVRDYLILHELMHLCEMNHSHRFWHHVERVCPDYKTAERWLKQHSSLLNRG